MIKKEAVGMNKRICTAAAVLALTMCTVHAEIDVAAVDRQNNRLFIGECKYHQKPVDLPVLTALQQKVAASVDLQNSFIRQGYHVLYGLFSKSGFSDRLLAFSKECDDLLLINEDQIIRL